MPTRPLTGPAAAALGSFRVDRGSPVPLYFQLAQHLEKVIASGEIPPGTIFENEIQLAETISVSRPTMRRAMQHLVDQGLIVRRRGIGTRVVQPKVRRPLELTSLHDDLAGSGQAPTTEVLSFTTMEADEQLAEKMHLQMGDEVVEIVRLRSAQGNPIAKMTNYLPVEIVSFDADTLASRGLYELLRAKGIQLHSATQTIGARTSTSAEAKLLGEARGAALLAMERITFDDRGSVVEYGTHLYAASRYSFEIQLLST